MLRRPAVLPAICQPQIAYQSMLATHLRPFFGGMRLAALSLAVVRRFAAEKAEAPERQGVKVGYLPSNPAADEEQAVLERREMDSLTPEEIRRLIAHSREPYATVLV